MGLKRTRARRKVGASCALASTPLYDALAANETCECSYYDWQCAEGFRTTGIAATECELEFIAYPVGCEGTFSVAPYRKVADNACSGGVQRASEAVETHACPASFECACVHGQCTSGECATQCTCDKGFYGPTCAVAANVCAELCKHGTCITIDHCANCESGWTGAWCDAVEQPFQVASDSEGHMSAAAGAVLALFIVLVLCVCGGGIGYYAWSRHYKVVHV